jgi:hypothetical protein
VFTFLFRLCIVEEVELKVEEPHQVVALLPADFSGTKPTRNSGTSGIHRDWNRHDT